MTEFAERAIADLSRVFAALADDAADPLVEAILAARRIAVYGCGREGLAIRGFAMRLNHLGLDAHVVGDMTTPPVGQGDLLIVTSGQGSLATGEALLQIAAAAGAATVMVTAQPRGRAAAMAGIIVVIPAQTMADDRPGGDGKEASILPMGSLFELAETIFFELVVLGLRDRLGETADTMRERHTNLE